MNRQKIKVIYLALIIIAVITMIRAVKSPIEEDVCLNRQKIRELDDEWRRKDTDELVETGGRKQYRTDGTLIIYRFLPHDIKEDDNLLLSSSHSKVEVFIGDEKIYTYGEQREGWLMAPGSAWLIVPLHEKYEGKEIVIATTSYVKKYKGRISDIYIADRASAILFITEQNKIGIVTGYMILTMGILLFIIWLNCLRVYNIRKLLYLSLFSIILYIWSLGESTMLQFSIGNMRAINIISFELIILLQFPMMLFFSINESNEVRVRFQKYLYIPVINFLICNYLFLVHRIDLTESITVTHISLALCIFASICTIYNEKRRILGKRFYSIKQWKLDSWGFLFMVIMALCDIVRYYSAYYSDSAMYSRFGLLIFIITLGIQTINSSIKKMLEAQKNSIYKHMAYHDCLTQMYNRTAYEKRLHELMKPNELPLNTCVLAVDINNLKYVNDTFGHAKGDQYIIENAIYCRELFSDIADCYRTGGDEFVIICPGKNMCIFEERMIRLHEEEFSRNHFAYGFAKFDPKMDQTIVDLIARADKIMYENKEMYR